MSIHPESVKFTFNRFQGFSISTFSDTETSSAITIPLLAIIPVPKTLFWTRQILGKGIFKDLMRIIMVPDYIISIQGSQITVPMTKV